MIGQAAQSDSCGKNQAEGKESFGDALINTHIHLGRRFLLSYWKRGVSMLSYLVTTDGGKRMSEIYDIAILGAGPAGISAVVYGKSRGKKVLVLEKLMSFIASYED